MNVPSYFLDFLTTIRPTDAMCSEYKDAHKLLRKRLRAFDTIKDALVTDFLQGSYRRSTLVRPISGKLADVDIIVVTKLDPTEWTAPRTLALFSLFAKEHYDGKYEVQGRSVRINLSGLSLDIVPTSAPAEAEIGVLSSIDVDELDELDGESLVEKALRKRADGAPLWKSAPLKIPDRDAKCWEETHPLAQIAWTREHNAASNGHYVNVIKALKWWRQEALKDLKRPKGYPLERAFAECFPSGAVGSVAEGLTLTMETFVTKFKAWRDLSLTPILADHGLPNQNVMKRIDGADFAALYDAVVDGATLARAALDATTVKASAEKWRELLGTRFPAPPEETEKSDGFTPRTGPSSPRPARYG